MDFKSFQLVQTDMTAQRRVYEGYKTENGVHLEYYISTDEWMIPFRIMRNAVIPSAKLTETKSFSKSCVNYSVIAELRNGRIFTVTILRCLTVPV